MKRVRHRNHHGVDFLAVEQVLVVPVGGFNPERVGNEFRRLKAGVGDGRDFAFFGKKIKSRFFRSFLYYIPYAVLSAMTLPAIFYSTGNIYTAIAGTAVAVALAFFEMPLIVVAIAAAGAAFVTGFLV